MVNSRLSGVRLVIVIGCHLFQSNRGICADSAVTQDGSTAIVLQESVWGHSAESSACIDCIMMLMVGGTESCDRLLIHQIVTVQV